MKEIIARILDSAPEDHDLQRGLRVELHARGFLPSGPELIFLVENAYRVNRFAGRSFDDAQLARILGITREGCRSLRRRVEDAS